MEFEPILLGFATPYVPFFEWAQIPLYIIAFGVVILLIPLAIIIFGINLIKKAYDWLSEDWGMSAMLIAAAVMIYYLI